MSTSHADAIIVGSGAGGAALAAKFSDAGLRVVVLEKGPRHRREAFQHDEILMAARPATFIPGIDEDPHVLLDHASPNPQPKKTTLGWIASGYGGGTVHFGGSCYRFQPDDFRLRSLYGAFEAVEDWPYGYDDLEAFYSEAEWALGVSGSGGADPYEGFRSRPYPMPPIGRHSLHNAFDAACAKHGLIAFPTPKAINSVPFAERPACAHCELCAGYGCPTGARGSVLETLLPQAEKTGRCVVNCNTMVKEVLVGPDGRARGCVYVDDCGREQRIDGRLVCICCSAVESARLLMLSVSPRHTNGLGNGNRLVGRNLQLQLASLASATFARPRQPEPEHLSVIGSIMDDYVLRHGPFRFPKGGAYHCEIARMGPVAFAARMAFVGNGDGTVMWGEPLMQRLRGAWSDYQFVTLGASHDYVPNAGSYVELDPVVTDKWGLPAARLHLTPVEHHREIGQWLVGRVTSILEDMGGEQVTVDGVAEISTILAHGTCRAGHDPETSVLDQYCRLHEVPNVYVVDGSFMPTSGGVPSTLTIIANAFRTAAHILKSDLP